MTFLRITSCFCLSVHSLGIVIHAATRHPVIKYP